MVIKSWASECISGCMIVIQFPSVCFMFFVIVLVNFTIKYLPPSYSSTLVLSSFLSSHCLARAHPLLASPLGSPRSLSPSPSSLFVFLLLFSPHKLTFFLILFFSIILINKMIGVCATFIYFYERSIRLLILREFHP